MAAAILAAAGLSGCSRTVHRTALVTWSPSDADRDPQFPASDPIWLRFEKYPNSRLLIYGKGLWPQLEAIGKRTVRVEFEVREAASWNGWKGYGFSVAAVAGKPFVDGGSARPFRIARRTITRHRRVAQAVMDLPPRRPTALFWPVDAVGD